MISFYYNFLLINEKILEAINVLNDHLTSQFGYEHTAVNGRYKEPGENQKELEKPA